MNSMRRWRKIILCPLYGGNKENCMKNWKQWTLVAILIIFGIMVGFTACDNDNSNDNGGQTPEDLPVKERWFSWVDPTSTTTLMYSVSVDGVVTVNIGGTAEVDYDIWKAMIEYSYTAKKNKHYAYTFEAWTAGGEGERELNIQYYYEEGGDDLVFEPRLKITETRKTYTLINETPIPKNGVRALSFQGANKTGTFCIKIVSITEVTGPGN
jgi:hypothetical protein